jgi:RNA polymerase sigma factor (sigma-70 family)
MSSLAAPPVSRVRRAQLASVSDDRLAQRVKAGDESAFAALYARHHQELYRYCRSILRSDTDAQDALQSCFERALMALCEGRRGAPVRPWLFRIAHNEAITVIRRRTALTEREAGAPAFAASAAHEAEQRARLSTLLEDLADLPERARSALVMRELSELSHEDIAAALAVSVGAAKQAIFEARRALQEAQEGRAMPCEEIRRKISDGDRRGLRGRRVRAHLRDCAGCAQFAAAIPARRAELRGLVPVLPPAAAATILTRALAGAGAHGAAGAGLGTGAAGGGLLGKGALGAALGSKVAVGAAVLATFAGAGGVAVVLRAARHPARLLAAGPAATTARSSTAAAHRVSATHRVVGVSTRSAAGVRTGAAAGARAGRTRTAVVRHELHRHARALGDRGRAVSTTRPDARLRSERPATHDRGRRRGRDNRRVVARTGANETGGPVRGPDAPHRHPMRPVSR